MAAHGWGTNRSVKQTLFKEGYRFEFEQAVRLIEMLFPKEVSVGKSAEPEKEAVRFKSRVSLSFPASDIQEIRPPAEADGPVEMTVNFMGLAGAQGPLPAPYAELILDRQRYNDTALRDFLDIFNHRLVSLLYRLRRLHRIGYDGRAPDQSHVVRYLLSLIGLGTPGLQNRLQIKDRALLYYTALLGRQPRSMTGLEMILRHYFQVKVSSRQLCGIWYRIEADQHTRLGLSGQNQILGENTILGTRIWDQQGRFEIRLEDLDRDGFASFLPTGDAYVPLCQMIRFYVGIQMVFDIVLILKAEAVPAMKLDPAQRPRLGWTTWLGSGEARPGQVRLSPRLLNRGHYPDYLLDAMGITPGTGVD